MTDARPQIRQKRRVSAIWIIPIVAFLLGIWMVIFNLQSQGPEITIVFSTAEGLEAGKTKLKLRNVEIGLVETVVLGDDLESVVVTAQVEKEAEPLLREDTQMWVVRPRIGKGGVSGLSTVLSGGYIQIAPGQSSNERSKFVGLETPPVTPAGTPGKALTIISDRAGSIGVGDSILYKGYRVGSVETEEFDVEKNGMEYGIFVKAPFDDLVTTSTRFWNVSGLSFTAGADGIKASTGSLDTLLMGGVEFGLPLAVDHGEEVASGMQFLLYDNYAAVNERPYQHGIEYVVEFPQSVRGLKPGAPVEYRGLSAGHVERVMMSEMATQGDRGDGRAIPVLIRLEPARLNFPDTEDGISLLQDALERGVEGGMRATLSTGNLLTGSLYVAFDMYPDQPKASLGDYAGRTTIPTIESGLGGLEQRVAALLDKINDLPLDQTLAELQGTLASLNQVLAGDGMQSLPSSMDATLKQLQQTVASFSGDSELQSRLLPTITELDRTLASLREVLDTIAEQPNALIFNRAQRDDPRPPAGSQ